MRQFIIASHAHFAAGINESVSLLSGERGNIRTLSMYVDGNNDLAAAAAKMLDETPEGDDLVVCTDLFGGSVNNEFTSIVQRRPNTYLVTNMNLPLLIQLLFAEEGRDTAEVIREICAADDTVSSSSTI
ncbi:MAG: PTS sugar transporter subunit IIA [Collinsella aerofaciens]